MRRHLAALLMLATACTVSVSAVCKLKDKSFVVPSSPMLEDTADIRSFMSSCVSIGKVSLTGPVDVLGAGVVIHGEPGSPLVILTVLHVVDAATGGSIIARLRVDNIEMLVPVVLVAKEPGADLALLQSTQPWLGRSVSAHLASTSPDRGAAIWAVGSPDGFEFNVTKGVISNLQPCPSLAGNCYRSDAAIYFGNSGGGVFNAKGELIGIVDSVSVDVITDAKGNTHYAIIPGSSWILSWGHLKAMYTKYSLE